MSEFWNARYGEEGFAYGTEPNAFLKSELATLTPGKILFPAEGEGRNAVYAASLGWEVTAFDSSRTGREKAMGLAASRGVTIDYTLCGYADFHAEQESFDCIALIFAHQPPMQRHAFHRQLVEWLKPGGHVILEGFSKAQLGRGSGGPGDLAMLFSEEELRQDFSALADLSITQEQVTLDEGRYHVGTADVIRLTGHR